MRNTGPGRLPMGFGTHPWFPATIGGAPRAATEVRVPGKRYWRLEELVPTGETVPVETAPAGREEFDLRAWNALDGNAYDDVFTALVRRPDGWSEAGIRYPNAGLELLVEASPVFREWVIFAPTERAGGLPRAVHRDDQRRQSAGPGGGRRTGRAGAGGDLGGDDPHLAAAGGRQEPCDRAGELQRANQVRRREGLWLRSGRSSARRAWTARASSPSRSTSASRWRPGDLLVNVDLCGVCGSDVHWVHATPEAQARMTYPMFLGHEWTGTIAELGERAPQVDITGQALAARRPGVGQAAQPAGAATPAPCCATPRPASAARR